MKEIENYVNQLKSLLKENLSAENLELSKTIDESLNNILAEDKKRDEKLNKANETLLNLVKTTSFKPTEEDKIQEERPKSIDEAFNEAFNLV